MYEYAAIVTPDGRVWELRTSSAQVRAYVRNGAGYIGGGTSTTAFKWYAPPRTYFKIVTTHGELVGALWGDPTDALLWLQRYENMAEPYYSDNAGRIHTNSGNLTKYDLVEYIP